MRRPQPCPPHAMKFIALLACLLAVSVAAAADEYNDWLKHFYQTQDIGTFDGYWQQVVKQGMLTHRNRVSPTLGFVSQVFHRYPALMHGRVDDLTAFSIAERSVVIKLLWLSNTDQARQILAKAAADEVPSTRPPAIGAWKISSGQDLDFCWGWYFATGDTAALDPIIGTLDLGKDAGALKRYPNSRKTAADRQAAMNDAIFGAALWSLGANGREDPRVAKHIRICFFAADTPQPRKMWLGIVMAKASPEVPRAEIEANQAGR